MGKYIMKPKLTQPTLPNHFRGRHVSVMRINVTQMMTNVRFSNSLPNKSLIVLFIQGGKIFGVELQEKASIMLSVLELGFQNQRRNQKNQRNQKKTKNLERLEN